MHIIVPIKQVPETGNVKMDEKTGTMIRDGVESIVNPLDLYAIECAIQLKEAHGGTVTVISMGPPKAEKAIRDCLAGLSPDSDVPFSDLIGLLSLGGTESLPGGVNDDEDE